MHLSESWYPALNVLPCMIHTQAHAQFPCTWVHTHTLSNLCSSKFSIYEPNLAKEHGHLGLRASNLNAFYGVLVSDPLPLCPLHCGELKRK